MKMSFDSKIRLFKKLIIFIHGKLFIRRSMFKFNRLIYSLGLQGMGISIDNSHSEENFLKQYLLDLKNPVVFDVGANVGDYSKLVKKISMDSTVYAFEPHPKTYLKLKETAQENEFTALNVGFGEEEGVFNLYDYRNNDGSEHASLYKGAIESIHKGEAVEHKVGITTLDNFLKTNSNIEKINLLKIDVEGNELMVLRGARRAISEGKIDIIQFEFNELNVVSRIFFKDFYDLLEDYGFYRLLPDGIADLGEYRPIFCEIFSFQNIIAIHKKLSRSRK